MYQFQSQTCRLDYPKPSFRNVRSTYTESIFNIMTMKTPCVYMLANQKNGTLYTGVTSDLIARIYEHKNNLIDGFTKKYQVHDLVWYELHETMGEAISREKQLKKWRRKWKKELIEQENPQWGDLYDSLLG
jgi:putative endonuclease